MTPHVRALPHLELVRAAADQEPILANLLELYAHDFSEFFDLELRENGRFGYRSLPLYWSDPNRHPFLIRLDGRLGGLVLVQKGTGVSGNDAVWDMAEFFVVRGCRRRGIGTQVAHNVWRQFPGRWEVRVMQANVPARHVWAKAISSFAGESLQPFHFENSDGSWTVFSFESKSITRPTFLPLPPEKLAEPS
jgi:predicted acetyltransferase